MAGERAIAYTMRRDVDMFWRLMDDTLNAVLSVLIGMEVLQIAFTCPLLLGARGPPWWRWWRARSLWACRCG